MKIKLYDVPNSSPVAELVEQIEHVCEKRGYTLSRWQANKGNFATKITYAVHRGKRADQFRYMRPDDVIAVTYLSQHEGKTERSEAYRKLSRLLTEIR